MLQKTGITHALAHAVLTSMLFTDTRAVGRWVEVFRMMPAFRGE